MIPSPLSWTIWGFFGRKRIPYGRLRPRVHLRNQDSHFHHLWVEGFCCGKILLWERKSWSILIRNHDSISTIFDELRFFAKISFVEGKKSRNILRKHDSIISTISFSWCFLQKRFFVEGEKSRSGLRNHDSITSTIFFELRKAVFFSRKIWLWEIRRKMAVLCHCKSQILSLQQQQKRL